MYDSNIFFESKLKMELTKETNDKKNFNFNVK